MRVMEITWPVALTVSSVLYCCGGELIDCNHCLSSSCYRLRDAYWLCLSKVLILSYNVIASLQPVLLNSFSSARFWLYVLCVFYHNYWPTNLLYLLNTDSPMRGLPRYHFEHYFGLTSKGSLLPILISQMWLIIQISNFCYESLLLRC